LISKELLCLGLEFKKLNGRPSSYEFKEYFQKLKLVDLEVRLDFINQPFWV
jgi:hypothetical protein